MRRTRRIWRLLRLDEITSVAVAAADQEAARDLVRAREHCGGDLMRARHRLIKLLPRLGSVYEDGTAWTGKHDRGLGGHHLAGAASQAVLDAKHEIVLKVKARRESLDRAIWDPANDSGFSPVVEGSAVSAA